jgi:hypothetical protein
VVFWLWRVAVVSFSLLTPTIGRASRSAVETLVLEEDGCQARGLKTSARSFGAYGDAPVFTVWIRRLGPMFSLAQIHFGTCSPLSGDAPSDQLATD